MKMVASGLRCVVRKEVDWVGAVDVTAEVEDEVAAVDDDGAAEAFVDGAGVTAGVALGSLAA